MDRQELEFDVGGDALCGLAVPGAGEPARPPIVVMAHGLSGTRRDGLGPFAERFAAAGIAALVFDHRGFGDSGGEPDLFDPGRQLEDWRAAIACARSLPGVDPERVATFGSSMGGGNALAAAAADPRVAAAISQVPFLDMVRQAHRSSPLVSARMLSAAPRGRHLPAVGQPDEAGLHQRPRRRGGLAPRRRDRRGLALAQPRLLALAAGPPLPPGPPRRRACTAPGCSASARPTGSPSRGRRSRRRDGRRSASCAPTPASTTSTSTTAPRHEAVVADQLAFLRRHLLAGG